MDAAADLRAVRGLHDLWAGLTQGADAQEPRPVPMRPLLDTLGLGVTQTLTHLGTEQPGWEAFAAWVVDTAGPPDPPALDRWHAWLDGAAPPAAEVERQAAVMAAEPALDAAALAVWESDGVVVLRSAITRDEATAIADHLWATTGADPDDPSTWSRARSGGIMVEAYQHPSMDVPRRAPRVAKAFAQLHGHADLVASTDRLSLNPPERDGYAFPGPHLHWDESLAAPVPFGTQAILYLTDTEADQGALQVVPGFHHRLAEGWLEALGGADPRRVDLSAEAEPVPAARGDLVIWRQEIPHGASANRSDRPRLAQYVNQYPMRWPDARPWI